MYAHLQLSIDGYEKTVALQGQSIETVTSGNYRHELWHYTDGRLKQ
jgi:hypothetical protein